MLNKNVFAITDSTVSNSVLKMEIKKKWRLLTEWQTVEHFIFWELYSWVSSDTGCLVTNPSLPVPFGIRLPCHMGLWLPPTASLSRLGPEISHIQPSVTHHSAPCRPLQSPQASMCTLMVLHRCQDNWQGYWESPYREEPPNPGGARKTSTTKQLACYFGGWTCTSTME